MASDVHDTRLTRFCNHFSLLGWCAMLTEVNLTPKPGLVDRRNNGSHQDMALNDFYLSASVIYRWLPSFIRHGARTCDDSAPETLRGLRLLGIACEKEMYCATGGVNTHKGTIFALGLLCAALGRHYRQRIPLTTEALCNSVAAMSKGLVANELETMQIDGAFTAGQRLWLKYGLSGARGEAESGFATVRHLALPHYRQLQREGRETSLALLDTLLLLIAHNQDTNVAARGGIDGLMWIQQTAQDFLRTGGVREPGDLAAMRHFDDQCMSRNLSPGGSADLLIVTWFLYHLSEYEGFYRAGKLP